MGKTKSYINKSKENIKKVLANFTGAKLFYCTNFYYHK